MDLDRFPIRLREIRKERNWTQADLADSLGVSRPYVSMLERGASSPSVEILVRLSNLFGLPMSEMFMDDIAADGSLDTSAPGIRPNAIPIVGWVLDEGVVQPWTKMELPPSAMELATLRSDMRLDDDAFSVTMTGYASTVFSLYVISERLELRMGTRLNLIHESQKVAVGDGLLYLVQRIGTKALRLGEIRADDLLWPLGDSGEVLRLGTHWKIVGLVVDDHYNYVDVLPGRLAELIEEWKESNTSS